MRPLGLGAFGGFLAAPPGRPLGRLGVPVETAAAGHVPSSASHPSCLAVAAPGEVMARGRKLVGSAQVRRRGTLLQQGALPRCTDADLLARVNPGARRPPTPASLAWHCLMAAAQERKELVDQGCLDQAVTEVLPPELS